MTPEIETTISKKFQPAANALRPRARGAGHTAFELLLNLQLLSKMPEAGGSDRLRKQIEAQERRSDKRTGRAAAQEQPKGTRERLAPRGAERNVGTRQGVVSSAWAGASAGTSGARGTVGVMGSQNEPASVFSTKPAQAALAGTDSPPASASDADRKDATGPLHNRRGGLGSLLNSHASARSVSASGRSVEAASSAKAGGSSVMQHGWSAARSGGRTADIARGRPSVPTNRARSFHLDQQKVLAQMGRGLAAALKREGGVVTLRLRPETLGELKIKIELSQGRVNAVFRADNESARQLLESSLDALKSSLEAKGLRVDRLFVEPPDESGHKQQSGSQSEPNDRGQTPGGDREALDDGDRSGHSPGMANDDADSDPLADAEASADQITVSDARIAEDSTPLSGLYPGEDEILVRVRLDAVA